MMRDQTVVLKKLYKFLGKGVLANLVEIILLAAYISDH